MLLVHQRYFAKPGLAGAVLRTRHKADAALMTLGLPVGRTFVPLAPDGGEGLAPDTPDVVWEGLYDDIEHRRRVETVLDASPLFTAIRREQTEQLRRFAREYYETR